MPSIYQLKPRFQALLRPTVQRLHARGVTANQVTLAAAGVSVLLGALVAAFAGMLDRLDSVCFAAPIFFHVLRYGGT
jgi:CDP-diacylglycerol--glycerol-3-phosphate 3-phosphatidyltransferase